MELEGRFFTPNSIIMCADVKNLYPSIPIQFGVDRVRQILTDFHHQFPLIDIPLTCELLLWVLQNSYVIYQDVIYHQVSGTAMGTSVAVSYAQIVLYSMERNLVDGFSYYTRFIDDIFAITTGSSTALSFVDQFQQICPDIQLDGITMGNSGIFLDLQLSLVDNVIVSELYQKAINKYQYIPPFSAHPPHVMRSVIQQEINRIRISCSSDYTSLSYVSLFKNRLLARGYNLTYLDRHFDYQPSRPDLLKLRARSSKLLKKPKPKRPILIIKLPRLKSDIKFSKLLALPVALTDSALFKSCYSSPDIMVVRKNFRSLGYVLAQPTNTNQSAPSRHKS
jgi:hypothetical protein